jgi:hypothetical protein
MYVRGPMKRFEAKTAADASYPSQDSNLGPVIEISKVGGLHHHYERQAA